MTIAPPTPTSVPKHKLPQITWDQLPDDLIVPDDPVKNNLQPLLAQALRESLELAGLILDSMLVATNFGLCATLNTKIVIKAPDWVYIAKVNPLPEGQIRRSYTPHVEGEGQRSLLTVNWLRWWDEFENLLPWSSEVIEQERQKAERAESRLQQEQEKCQRLADRLKALGVDMDLDEDQ